MGRPKKDRPELEGKQLLKGKYKELKTSKQSLAQRGNTNSVGNKGGTGNPVLMGKWKDQKR